MSKFAFIGFGEVDTPKEVMPKTDSILQTVTI